ncbi:DEAD-box ATP-dependent RNA helicase 8 [Lathyrus oleraceus]|uniref:DEAD-box ATP-dependent RNA helicase 8 n=1 Tax=Pisum sativum TaxID=3888 RepID=UPI0021CFA3E6|nr:DEAD-box ATP-dependent RNA helicase 8-like [Pisum sativum]
MKEIAEAFLGKIIRDAVVTAPVYFDDAQRQATTDVDVIVGFNGARILSEPDATAENTEAYVNNTIQRVQNDSGPPSQPNIQINTYIYELFKEDKRSGPISKNFGAECTRYESMEGFLKTETDAATQQYQQQGQSKAACHASTSSGSSNGYSAFCIPALKKIDQDNGVIQVVILAPTRELALQTSQVCKELAKHLQIQVLLTTGGTSLKDDIMRLYRLVHLLVGTPGRILDLAKKGVCILKDYSMLVMDEVDKLLSPEFQPSIEQLIQFLPSSRQILMFSTTFPVTIKDFKDRYLRKPYIINLMDELTLKGITRFYAFVEERQKVHCLNTLFSKLQINQSIIFYNSVNRIELLAKKITELGYLCFYIHAKMQAGHY